MTVITIGQHRIVPAGVEGVAFQDSPSPHQTTFEEAEDLNGFKGVLGTRGREAARGPQHGRNKDLVEAYQTNGESGEEVYGSSPGRVSFGLVNSSLDCSVASSAH